MCNSIACYSNSIVPNQSHQLVIISTVVGDHFLNPLHIGNGDHFQVQGQELEREWFMFYSNVILLSSISETFSSYMF